MKELFGSEAAWWQSLGRKEKWCVVYFTLSLMLLPTAGGGIVWMAAVVANLAVAARVIKRIPIDKLEEE